jgi:signal transduction histidine kinase
MLAESSTEQLLNICLLLAVSIVGLLLIRSVYKEVEAREEIQRLSEQKSEFMTFASHEIRNPITAMRGYASLMLEGSTGPMAQQAKDTARKLLVLGNEVLTLIAQYLDKSKIELGQLNYAVTRFDAIELAREIVHEAEPNAELHKLTLGVKTDSNEPHWIDADRGKIKEVIANLVDNALKYTPRGFVSVSVEHREHAVRISVIDTGVGIPKETIEQLFKKFSRADAQKMNLLGTGLGLYLAKVFVEAHHGTIWAESDGEDKGSRFIIELPKGAAAESPLPSPLH